MSIQAQEVKTTDKSRVACDGGEGALGHPRVFLSVPEDEKGVECPYCDALYVRGSAAK